MQNSILAKTRTILGLENDIFRALGIFSLTVSVLSLAVPIAAQTLINFIAFANLLQPIVILCCIVLFVLIVSACVRIYQIRLVEWIQCRIFVRVGLQSADIFTRLKKVDLSQSKYREFVNYFFDVGVIKKSIASLMISGLEAILRTVFGMILLATYHPWLLIFDFALICAVILGVCLPFRKAVQSAIVECSAKHEVASWLEEIASMPTLFKLMHYPNVAFDLLDKKLCNFLEKRAIHFSICLRQITWVYIIVIVSSVTLLGLGAYLVIRGQLTLGQLVASEIVLTSMSASFIKLSNYLDDIYDGLASVDKVYELNNIGLEEKSRYDENKTCALVEQFSQPMVLTLDNVVLAQCEQSKSIHLTLHPGQTFLVAHWQDHVRHAFVDVLLGKQAAKSGSICVNNIYLEEAMFPLLRRHIAVARKFEPIGGDLLYNLTFDPQFTQHHELQQLLSKFALQQTITQLNKGLATPIEQVLRSLTQLQLLHLNLVRLLLGKPKLLILHNVITSLHVDELVQLINSIKRVDPELIIIATARDQFMAANFNGHLEL